MQGRGLGFRFRDSKFLLVWSRPGDADADGDDDHDDDHDDVDDDDDDEGCVDLSGCVSGDRGVVHGDHDYGMRRRIL